MTPLLRPLEREPGAFKAYCKMGAWRDVAEVLTMDPPLEGAYPERWNRELERSEMLVPCDFETTSAVDFEAHMAERHDRTPGWKPPLERGWEHGRTPVIKPRSPRPSSGGNGKPFKASTKAIEERLQTCPHCSLVAEVGAAQTSQLWWSEHLAGCALAQTVDLTGAAS